MKKIWLIISVALFSGLLSGCMYDDNELWDAVEDITNRVTELEKAVQSANSNIATLQTLVTALQNNVTITSVTLVYIKEKTAVKQKICLTNFTRILTVCKSFLPFLP